MNDPAQAIATLPAPAARMLATEILLADPEALADDVLEVLPVPPARAAAGSSRGTLWSGLTATGRRQGRRCCAGWASSG